MKLLLACTFLLAATYVSADKIKCLVCWEGNTELYANVAMVGSVGAKIPSAEQKCNTDNSTQSNTEDVATDGQECMKVDFGASIGDNDYSIIIRTYADKDKCEPLEKLFDAIDDAADSKLGDLDFECNQCDEEICNSAGTIQMSLLVLASSLMVYLMRS